MVDFSNLMDSKLKEKEDKWNVIKPILNQLISDLVYDWLPNMFCGPVPTTTPTTIPPCPIPL